MLLKSEAIADLARLEAIAADLLATAGISAPPTPTNLVAFCDPSRPVFVSSKPLGVLRGVLQPTAEGWDIIANSKLPQSAQRFSVFHEGYHILYRTGRFEPQRDGATPAEYHEWLADQFATRILMPRRWVSEIAAKAPLQRLCGVFQVSQKAMERRLRELGLRAP